MIAAFKARKPWVAALMALIFGPVVGMCYLQRGRIAFLYFMVAILSMVVPFLAAHAGILPIHPADALGIVSVGLSIAGALHCFYQQHIPKLLKWYARWYGLVTILVVPMLLAFGFRHFYYEPFHMPSGSMSPNANKGDYVFVKKFAPGTHAPARGEVILFKRGEDSYIKRVMGLPGDKIQMKDGILYINDVAVPRKQIENYAVRDTQGDRSIPQFMEALPDGKAIHILDETPHGFFDQTPAYIVPEQHYFVLGDHRDESHDSRDQETFGFVAQESITGKASVILWNDTARTLAGEQMH